MLPASLCTQSGVLLCSIPRSNVSRVNTRAGTFRNCSGLFDIDGGCDTQPVWKWRLVISYGGTNYSGWQVQKNCVTVQQKIEDALMKCMRFSREELKLVGAGRTDWRRLCLGSDCTFPDADLLRQFGTVAHVTSLHGILPPDI